MQDASQAEVFRVHTECQHNGCMSDSASVCERERVRDRGKSVCVCCNVSAPLVPSPQSI